jgi:hypothetical protein
MFAFFSATLASLRLKSVRKLRLPLLSDGNPDYALRDSEVLHKLAVLDFIKRN